MHPHQRSVTAVAYRPGSAYPRRWMADRIEWVLLAYRMPREPSTPRIAVWRKFRRLGVVQIVDGLVALPSDARTKEQLEWLADEVREAGGEATIWVGELASKAAEREMARRMADAVASEYRAIADAAGDAATETDVVRRRTLARLRRELRRVGRRDYFPPPERDPARVAVEQLGATVAVS